MFLGAPRDCVDFRDLTAVPRFNTAFNIILLAGHYTLPIEFYGDIYVTSYPIMLQRGVAGRNLKLRG